MTEEEKKELAQKIANILRADEVITPEKYYEARNAIYKEL